MKHLILALLLSLSALAQKPIETLADAEKAAVRAGIEAQSTSIGFLDRFDRSDRYAEAATITSLSSLPQVGTYPYRVRQDGATTPTVSSGALECGGATLYYLQNRVATPGGGKFSMGLVMELERTANYLTAINNGGGNISFAPVPMVDDVGNIGGLTAIAPAHLNWSNEGVTAFTLYPSTNLTCLNATAVGGVLPWNPDLQQLPLGDKFTILIRVEGDLIEVTAVGLGSLYFTHPDVSTKVGSDYTYFWHEPNGPTTGTGYRHVSRLYRWWAMAEEINQSPGYGLTWGVPSRTFRVPSQLQLYPNGSKSPLSANTPVGSSSAALRVAGRSTTTVGGYQKSVGGDVIIESFLSRDFGAMGAGGMFQAFMVGAVDSNLNAPNASTTAAAYSLPIGLNEFIYPLGSGDWETVFLGGTLAGAGNKQIRITSDMTPFGSTNVMADSNNVGTPLNGTTGFWTCEIKRYISGTNTILYTELKANGVLLHATRTVEPLINPVTLLSARLFFGVETTTADAGGVTVDTHIRDGAEINPR